MKTETTTAQDDHAPIRLSTVSVTHIQAVSTHECAHLSDSDLLKLFQREPIGSVLDLACRWEMARRWAEGRNCEP